MPPKPGDPVQVAPEQHEPAVPLSFWQLPWVQNVLPFATSVVLHVGILIIGIVFFRVVEYVARQAPHQEEVIVPDASMIDNGPPGGIPNQGLGNDPQHQAFQDKDPSAGTPQGWAEKKGTAIDMKAAGGGDGDSNDSTIGVSSLGGGFGHGKGGHGAGEWQFQWLRRQRRIWPAGDVRHARWWRHRAPRASLRTWWKCQEDRLRLRRLRLNAQ